MAANNKSRISQAGLTLILVLIIGFFLGTMIFILGNVYKQNNKKPKPSKQPEAVGTEESTEDPEADERSKPQGKICVLKEVDVTKKNIVLYDTAENCTVRLSYTGGTDIRDQYSQIIAASQLTAGEMVEAVYQESNQTLISLMRSPNTWEYKGVTGFQPDRKNKIVTLYGEKYKYSSKIYVRDPDGETTLLSINKDDVLTVRGYDKTVYSIQVTKGHGTLVLKNCESFEGGTIIVAGDEYNDFSSEMVFTVREGTVNIEMMKGGTKERTSVKVKRNKKAKVDISKFAPNPPEKGMVTFSIRPFGAQLVVDGEQTSYSEPVELEYGKHKIEVVLSGHETYEGIYELNSPTDIVQINLAETAQEEKPAGSYGSAESGSVQQKPSSSAGTEDDKQEKEESKEDQEDKENQEDKEESEESTNTDPNHTIRITSPIGASVYINGAFKGIAPVTAEKPLGVTYITLLKEGYEQITHTIDVEDDKENKTYHFPQLKSNRQ